MFEVDLKLRRVQMHRLKSTPPYCNESCHKIVLIATPGTTPGNTAVILSILPQ